MKTTLIIIDDFYSNPDGVRNFALTQSFSITGNFPGKRTKSFLTEDVKESIQNQLHFCGSITDWHEQSGYSGAFQLTTAQDRTWIHSDQNNDWAGVCYLTPNAPHTAGTGFFRHKATNHWYRNHTDYEGYDYTKWDLFDVIGNRYNRLILYRSDIFHASLDYFGSSDQDGRLFQTFFLNTSGYK